MIRSLKKRPRSDALANEKRLPPHSLGRIIYLSLLGIFSIAILNYLFGDLVFLHADGLVLRDKTVVAPSYVARIQQIDAPLHRGAQRLLTSRRVLHRGRGERQAPSKALQSDRRP